MQAQLKDLSSAAFVIGLLALLILGVVVFQVLRDNTGPTALATAMTTQAVTEFVATAETPPAVTPSSEVDKLYTDFQATGEANRAPKDPTLAPVPPTVQDPPFPTGLFEGGEGVFYSGDVTIQNRWQGLTDNAPTQIFAGALYQDPMQGIVIVLKSAIAERYLTPIKAGAVRIVAVENLRLVLEAASGQALYFDFPSRQFVDSLTATPLPATEALPSPTPQPLPTGYPGDILSPTPNSLPTSQPPAP